MNRKDRVIVCYPIRNKHTSEGIHNLTLTRRYLPFHLSRVNLRGTLYLSSGTCSYLFTVACFVDQSWGFPELTGLIKASLSKCEHYELQPPEDLILDLLLQDLSDLLLEFRFSLMIPPRCAVTEMREKKEIWEIWRQNEGFPFFCLFLHQYYPCHNLKMMLHQKRIKLILISHSCS